MCPVEVRLAALRPCSCELSQQVEDLALATRVSSLNIAKISVSVALMPLLL